MCFNFLYEFLFILVLLFIYRYALMMVVSFISTSVLEYLTLKCLFGVIRDSELCLKLIEFPMPIDIEKSM